MPIFLNPGNSQKETELKGELIPVVGQKICETCRKFGARNLVNCSDDRVSRVGVGPVPRKAHYLPLLADCYVSKEDR